MRFEEDIHGSKLTSQTEELPVSLLPTDVEQLVPESFHHLIDYLIDRGRLRIKTQLLDLTVVHRNLMAGPCGFTLSKRRFLNSVAPRCTADSSI